MTRDSIAALAVGCLLGGLLAAFAQHPGFILWRIAGAVLR